MKTMLLLKKETFWQLWCLCFRVKLKGRKASVNVGIYAVNSEKLIHNFQQFF